MVVMVPGYSWASKLAADQARAACIDGKEEFNAVPLPNSPSPAPSLGRWRRVIILKPSVTNKLLTAASTARIPVSCWWLSPRHLPSTYRLPVPPTASATPALEIVLECLVIVPVPVMREESSASALIKPTVRPIMGTSQFKSWILALKGLDQMLF